VTTGADPREDRDGDTSPPSAPSAGTTTADPPPEDAPPEDDTTDDGAEDVTGPRAPECDPRTGPADDDPVDPADPCRSEDPSEPCRSANATGIDATAAPTPNATANAPTRPTNRA
jgi:hypothetical protein